MSPTGIAKKPDWLSMQYDSFIRFFSQLEAPSEFSCPRIIGELGCIPLDDDHQLCISEWELEGASGSPEDCIKANWTYFRNLLFTFSIKGKFVTNGSFKFQRLMASIPAPTKDSEFIIESNRKKVANRFTLTMQLAPSPGIYLSEKDSEERKVITCQILPAIGKRIVLKVVIRPEGDLQLFSGKIGHDKEISRDQMKEIVDSIHCDMSFLGKRQMADLLRGLTEKIDETNSKLKMEELKAIMDLFYDGKIPQTDDRSLKNRKVKRIGDFLFEILNDAVLNMHKYVQEQWLARGEWMGGVKNLKFTDDHVDDFIPHYMFQPWIDQFYKGSELFQLLDTCNPIAEISQKRRLTMRGPDGFPEKALLLDKRDVHPTDFGRLCPVESPQGEDLGFNVHLAQDVRINDQGLIEVCLRDKETGKKVFLDPYEEEKSLMLFAGCGFFEMLRFAKTDKEEMTLLSTDQQYTHETLKPTSFLGYAAALIPFIQHNDANRALMGANMIKQALPLNRPEPPMIQTDFENIIASQFGKDCPFIVNGRFCFGKNLLVGYLPWDFLTYEDAIVVNGRLAREKILTHVEGEEIIVDEYHGEKISRENEHIREEERDLLDPDGVIKVGTSIKKGTLLVSKLRPLAERERPVLIDEEYGTQMLMATYLKRRGRRQWKENLSNMANDSLFSPDDSFGVVKEVSWVERDLPRPVSRRVRILIEKEHSLRKGDKLTGRHGNKGVVSQIIEEREMPYFKTKINRCEDQNCQVPYAHTHLDIIINPLTITGRMNMGQLYETALGWLAAYKKEEIKVAPFSTDWTWEKIKERLAENQLSHQQLLFFWKDGEEIPIGQHESQHRPMTVGYQYFLKLDHLAEKKLKVRDEAYLDPTYGQPAIPSLPGHPDILEIWAHQRARGKKAQRLGEMEVWALMGHGAWHILDELLSMKSDAEHLRAMLSEYILGIERSKEEALIHIKKHADGKGWTIKENEELTITCPDENGLRRIAYQFGFSVTKLGSGQYQLSYAPLEAHQREHRAFKGLVFYCRALGLDVQGIDEWGKAVSLVKLGGPSWPRLSGIKIRIASDQERKKWARESVVSRTGGIHESGLWSDMLGDPFSPKKTLREQAKESSSIIELCTPIDNPLFRRCLEVLLDWEGFLFRSALEVTYDDQDKRIADELETAFQRVVINLFPKKVIKWEEFWKRAWEDRSRLQTVDDLIDWLETVAKPEKVDRHALAEQVATNFPRNEMMKFKWVLDPTSKYSLDPEELFEHFRLMDLSKMKNRLENVQKQQGTGRQLELVKTLLEKGYHPKEAFFIGNLYVLPKNLRYERRGRHFKTHHPRYENDLNVHYERIVLKNEAIKEFKKKIANKALPSFAEWIVGSEEKKLAYLVHGFLVNDKIPDILEDPIRTSSGRLMESVLSCLAGHDSGKESIFREHLLGKRVDFSGRAVIVPDPELGLDQVGLPYRMGKVLFRDGLIAKCLTTIPTDEEILDLDGNPYNPPKSRRIPDSVRIEMAKTFISESENEAKVRAWLDEIAGEHYVLLNRAPSLHRLSILAFIPKFYPQDDVLHLNPSICSPFNADFDGDTMAVHVPMLENSMSEARRMLPSHALRSPGHGRLLVDHGKDWTLAHYLSGRGSIQPSLYETFNEAYKKGPEEFRKIVQQKSKEFRDILKRCGFTLSLEDFIIDEDLQDLILTHIDRYNSSLLPFEEERVQFWIDRTKEVIDLLEARIPSKSALDVLLKSRAAKVELNQIAGMRGIMLRPGGRYTSYPILSNLIRGMSPLEYFVSCHGARHGLSDKGLMTGPAGDLTNILVQATHGDYIVEEDCETENGLWITTFEDPDGGTIALGQRLEGRYLADDITLAGEKIPKNTTIGPEMAKKLSDSGVTWVKIRSPITCQALDQNSVLWKSFLNQWNGRILASPINELGLILGTPLDQANLLKIARHHIPAIEVFREEEYSLLDWPTDALLGEDIQLPGMPPIQAGTILTENDRFEIGKVRLNQLKMDESLQEFRLDELRAQIKFKAWKGKEKIQIPQVWRICQKCYGLDLSTGKEPSFGYPAGIIGAQSIGEPGTQLTLRTFHTGGIAGQGISQGLQVARRAFFMGTIEEPVKSSITGDAQIIKSPSGFRWLEITGEGKKQRLPLVDIDPVAGWSLEMEERLRKDGKIDFVEESQTDGTTVYKLDEHKIKSVVRENEVFSVQMGQRVFFTRTLQNNQKISIKKLFNQKVSPLAATEYLLHVLQKIYNANSRVADHHFEVVLRSMVHLAPKIEWRTLLQAALAGEGFLSRLSFRRLAQNLAEAALYQETDYLKGLKEKIIAGQIRYQ